VSVSASNVAVIVVAAAASPVTSTATKLAPVGITAVAGSDSAAGFVWLSVIVVLAATTQSTKNWMLLVCPTTGGGNADIDNVEGPATTSTDAVRELPNAAAVIVSGPGVMAVNASEPNVAPDVNGSKQTGGGTDKNPSRANTGIRHTRGSFP
jgi:NADPH-dependent curcumin reductase CurA